MTYPHRSAYDDALCSTRTALAPTGEANLMDGVVTRLSPCADKCAGASMCALYVLETKESPPRRVVLRVFTDAIPADLDLERRYQVLSDELPSELRQALVPLRFYPAGVLLNADAEDALPLVVMDWIEGTSLLEWLERLYFKTGRGGQRDAWRAGLQDILDQLVVLLELFQRHEFGWGDPAPRNLLVTPEGRLVPIDYDFVYLPALAGLAPYAGWQPGYAHPDVTHGYTRDPSGYSPRMDHFASLVMVTALLALREDPGLWAWRMKRSRQGEQLPSRLLFDQSDLNAPQRSPIFRVLEALTAPDLQRVLRALRHACSGPLAATPHPADALRPPASAPTQVRAQLTGETLEVRWAWPSEPIDGVAIDWSATRWPSGKPEAGVERRYVWRAAQPTRPHQRFRLTPHHRGQELQVVVTPVRRHAYDPQRGTRWADDWVLGRVVARPRRRIEYGLRLPCGTRSNAVWIRALDGHPLPDLVLAVGIERPPRRPTRDVEVAVIRGCQRDSHVVQFVNVPYQFTPRSYLKLFPLRDNDRDAIEIVAHGARRGGLQLTD